MKKITKIMAAGLLAVAAVTGLAGCGQSEQEKALAPYVGTWKYDREFASGNTTAHLVQTWIIKKDDKNENTLISSITKETTRGSDRKMDTAVHNIVFDQNNKMIMVDGVNPIVILSDDKGEYITGTDGHYVNEKFYKQK